MLLGPVIACANPYEVPRGPWSERHDIELKPGEEVNFGSVCAGKGEIGLQNRPKLTVIHASAYPLSLKIEDEFGTYETKAIGHGDYVMYGGRKAGWGYKFSIRNEPFRTSQTIGAQTIKASVELTLCPY
jgi:hypothetical protein